MGLQRRLDAAEARALAAERTAAEATYRDDLQRRLAAAEERAISAEARIGMWESLISFLAYAMAMGPDRGEYYKRTLVKQLSDALTAVDAVHEVDDCICSLPTVVSEAPQLSLVRLGAHLSDPMEWRVRWSSASWSLSVSVL